MKEILLTKGYSAIVDDDDYEKLKQYNWCYAYGYAVKSGRRKGKNREPLQFMHHYIIDRKDGFVTDHINRNTLDNRKENLRYADLSQNKANQTRITRKSKSGYTGVYYEPSKNKWRARFQAYKKRVTVGYYNTPKEAAIAYNNAMREAFGEYACLNKV